MIVATYARKSTDQHGVSDEGGDTMKETKTKTIKVGSTWTSLAFAASLRGSSAARGGAW
jgi:hypothetical protein